MSQQNSTLLHSTDIVSRCAPVMQLIDEYELRPTADNRLAIREALLALAAPRWQPLTPELLRQIEQEDRKDLWLLTKYSGKPSIGQYEWQQGRNPHGFNTLDQDRVSASDVTHVAAVIFPVMPR